MDLKNRMSGCERRNKVLMCRFSIELMSKNFKIGGTCVSESASLLQTDEWNEEKHGTSML